MKYRAWNEKHNCWDELPMTCYPNEDFVKQGKTIQWFTGLKDKNGKEIYEGDIVNNKITYDKYAVKYAYEVVFKDFGWAITDNYKESVPFCYLLSENLEVIGNIFELPCKPDHNGECIHCDCWMTDCQFRKNKKS